MEVRGAPIKATTIIMAAPTWMTKRLPTPVICMAPMFSLCAVVLHGGARAEVITRFVFCHVFVGGTLGGFAQNSEGLVMIKSVLRYFSSQYDTCCLHHETGDISILPIKHPLLHRVNLAKQGTANSLQCPLKFVSMDGASKFSISVTAINCKPTDPGTYPLPVPQRPVSTHVMPCHVTPA